MAKRKTPKRDSSPRVDPAELARLIPLAQRLVDSDRDDDVQAQVDDFNRLVGCNLAAEDFRRVPAACEVDDFVRSLLVERDAPAVDHAVGRDELIALIRELEAPLPKQRDEMNDVSLARRLAAERALVASSRLPDQLAASFTDDEPMIRRGSPEDVDFVLGYAPPATADEVWATARAWAAYAYGKQYTPRGYVGQELLDHELARIDVPELRAILAGLRKIPNHPIAHRQYLERAGLLEPQPK